ncbi:MAG: hypothetical protein HY691_13375 [Chloroflexi bacterium]|nr:hypothetical protein [Chloroflexota bacterium]
MVRCMRALEARDAIGEQFYYLPQTADTENRMLYHFDYLTLLLSGAVDAQARVAHRTYAMSGKEQDAGFRRCKFQEKLKRSGAQTLYNLVTAQHFRDVAALLYEPRHRIHEAGFRTLTVRSAGFRDEKLAIVPSSMAQKLWEASERLGSPERWGLTKRHQDVLLEPYSYAVALVDEGFKAIDAVAAATELERLFHAYPMPRLMSGPPYASSLDEKVLSRIALLG